MDATVALCIVAAFGKLCVEWLMPVSFNCQCIVQGGIGQALYQPARA